MSGEKVLLAEDDAAIRTVVSRALSRQGYDVQATSVAAALWRWIAAGDGDVVITDVALPDENSLDLLPRIRTLRPDLPVIVMSAQNTLLTAVRAAERGAFEYLPKPFDIGNLVAAVQRSLSSRAAPSRSSPAENGLPEEQLPIIGRSPAMQEIYRVIARLMNTDLTVLIAGESGTGKELVAQALHDFGKRKGGPFVAVNMAAIPRELIESELFGHEKGSFTGANARRVGRFEQAEGGTLFLDEIGDMPLEAQTRLLRVLQQGEFVPVGGHHPVRTNVRIVAASHRDLRLMVGPGPVPRGSVLSPQRGAAAPAAAARAGRRHPGPGPALPGQGAGRRPAAEDADARGHGPAQVARLARQCPRAGEPRPPAGGPLRRGHDRRGRDRARARAGTAQPALDARGRSRPTTISASAIERHIDRYFRAHDGALPPPGVYDRLIREVERPLIARALAATRGNQLKAADVLGPQPQHAAQEDPRSGHPGQPGAMMRAADVPRLGSSLLARTPAERAGAIGATSVAAAAPRRPRAPARARPHRQRHRRRPRHLLADLALAALRPGRRHRPGPAQPRPRPAAAPGRGHRPPPGAARCCSCARARPARGCTPGSCCCSAASRSRRRSSSPSSPCSS